MKRYLIFMLMLMCGGAAAQVRETAAPKTPPVKEKIEKKTNARPTKPDAPKTEPFAAADVKTMAAQCVTLDTDAGAIKMEMFPESAPETVRNFLNLAATGAFDTTTFSRVVPGFVIQGGDLSTGANWSAALAERAAKTIPDEPNGIRHERGIVSMARSSEPNSATTDFFILFNTATNLDGTFAAFGRVIEGMDAAEAINKMPVENEKPLKPAHIKKATVAPCPAAAPDTAAKPQS